MYRLLLPLLVLAYPLVITTPDRQCGKIVLVFTTLAQLEIIGGGRRLQGVGMFSSTLLCHFCFCFLLLIASFLIFSHSVNCFSK